MITIPVLVGFTGVAFDLSNLMMHRREARNAADLAALAAAASLPGDAVGARAMGQRIASSNDYKNGIHGVVVTVTTPYQSDANQVQISVRDSVPTLFMRILGSKATVFTQSSVAKAPTLAYGVYGINGTCNTQPGGVVWTMNSGKITVPVFSGTDFRLTGSNNTVTGGVTYGCNSTVVGSQNNISPAVAKSAAAPRDPLGYSQSSFCPGDYNFTGTQDLQNPGPWWVGGTWQGRKLQPGVYCSTGTLQLTADGVSGTVTFVAADAVQITGTNFSLQPKKNNVLVAAYGTGQTTVTGSGGAWSGFFYVPHGTLQIVGSGNWVVNGGMVAAGVTLTGSATTFGGAGGSGTSTAPVLVK